MHCPSCGFENVAGARFCEECGAPCVRICPSCGQQVRPTAKFCPDCGMTLGAAETPLPAKSRKRIGTTSTRKARGSTTSSTTVKSRLPGSEAERRQLTVMFCDLVGSTPLSEKLDPEDLRAVILAYQQVCAEQIRRFEGYLARYVGDGLLVYFGYPQAHEDDAQRAIRVGLGIVAALPALNTQLQQTVEILRDFPLQVRIGIHTGLVIVGDMGGGGYCDPLAIVGETPNIAARIQGIAEPNTVVISEATYRLAQGLFECHARGPQALKGVSTPVPAYHVLRESEVQSRFEVAVRTGLTPLVGRDEELGLLGRRWEQAKAGEGQVVLLSGEPGIGKSRLVQALKEQASAEGATRIEFRCSPYYQNSAFYPIIDHLQRLLQFAPHDAPQAKLSKLQQALARYRFPQANTLPLLATLLSLPHADGVPLLTLSPQKQKQKTQEALVAWIIEEAEKTAVYCVWEDLHWADPSTLELLPLFLDHVPTTRLLALLTFRPEFRPPWGNRSHLSQLTLSRLGRGQVEMMIERVTGGKALPLEVVQQIVAKTDGVPLFVEELTKMVLESGLLRATDDHYQLTSSLPPLAIPSTLQDSLMARLDRLSTVREIAQVGAPLGREFSYDLLHAVSPFAEDALQQGLRQLVEAELVYPRGIPPQATYFFKHALIQDAAYQSLLKSTRQQYHTKIAQVLEQRFPDTKEIQPELLARHYTEAGLIVQAIPYWEQAGRRAIARSASSEALSHLTQGLALLQPLPQTPARAQQELRLQLLMSEVLSMVKGPGSTEREQVLLLARELCRQVGETPELFSTLASLFFVHSFRAEFLQAREMAEQVLTLAQGTQIPYLLLYARWGMGENLFCRGEFGPARVQVEQGIALYETKQYRPQDHPGLINPLIPCLFDAARALWMLGYPAQALQRIQEAQRVASELGQPYSLAVTLQAVASFHQFRGDLKTTQEVAEQLIRLSTEQGFPDWLAIGMFYRGWALTIQTKDEEGLAQMHQGAVGFQATGAKAMSTNRLANLAEGYSQLGQPEEGLRLLTEALVFVDKTEERYYEAELYRLQGELTLQTSSAASSQLSVTNSQSPTPNLHAEACFLTAIDIARRQQAKSLELRAVMSLSRLWQQQGKKTEAHRMLADTYDWFTEGFDTKDLQEARALLAELT
jgi:class 3 adenylate cyclase/predicted ATPase